VGKEHTIKYKRYWNSFWGKIEVHFKLHCEWIENLEGKMESRAEENTIFVLITEWGKKLSKQTTNLRSLKRICW